MKSVINLFSGKIGGIQGTFLPVKKLFKIDQYVFELILGSDNFLAIFVKYSCFEVSIKLSSLFCRELNLSRLLCYLQNPFCSQNV